MSRELFGTDGLRAVAGTYPLDGDGCEAIGRAVGSQFATPGEQIVIACDTRESSERIVADVSAGMRDMGVDVVFVGIMPTPALAYVTKYHKSFVAGVMVTASHNPYQYNGIKVFGADGGKLPDEAEERLNNDIVSTIQPRESGGMFSRNDLVSVYEKHILDSVQDLDLTGVRVAIDTANGAASGLGPRIFEKLGAEVLVLANTPDGKNINVNCGATNIAALQSFVAAHDCAYGIALDGDADRLIMVDHTGRECNGDHILYLLAVGLGYDHVTATVMTNLGAEQSLLSRNIHADRTDVGDRYVLERMLDTDCSIGGEQSGHIILKDFATTGDGLLAAVQAVSVLKKSGLSLAEWRDEVKMLPQSLVNFPLNDKTKLTRTNVLSYINKKTTELGKNGRILVRPSGTEPLGRVMVEAAGAETLANEITMKLQELIT